MLQCLAKSLQYFLHIRKRMLINKSLFDMDLQGIMIHYCAATWTRHITSSITSKIGQRCSTFTLLLLTFIRVFVDVSETERDPHPGSERLGHHSCEWQSWRKEKKKSPETCKVLHCQIATAVVELYGGDYMNPHLSTDFVDRPTSVSCQATTFPQIYRLYWINYL